MATPFHTTVDLNGIHFEDRKVTMVLASAVVKADEGKPVTIDTANNRVKLAGDGDNILGVLEVVEDRIIEGIKVGTIALNYVAQWPVKAADALAVGDVAVGAGSGQVKKATLTVTTGAEPAVKPWGSNFVVAVSSGLATVVKV
jgi:hypothetical protein